MSVDDDGHRRIVTLANSLDAFRVSTTGTVCFTPMPGRWKRIKAWFMRVVLRRREPPSRVWRVAAVNHEEGTVTLESP